MSEPEPEASPAQQEAVRRLLAEARHDEPTPPEVVARLDGVLAQLAAEGDRAVDPPPPVAPAGAAVIDLAARRRRRVTGLLGAAAAVVVLGVGVGQVVRTSDGGGSDASQSDAGVAAESDRSTDSSAGGSGLDGGDGPGAAAPPEDGPGSQPAPSRGTPPVDVPALDRSGFTQAVLRLRPRASVVSASDLSLTADQLTREPMFVCPPTAWGPGRLLAVTYAGAPAVLAYRPATGDTQTVELLQCDSGSVLRSVVVPAP